jgi:hypothetical protein
VSRDPARIEEILDEYLAYMPRPAQDDAAVLETALFLEQAFDLTLTDAEMSPAALGTREAMRALVLSKQGVR